MSTFTFNVYLVQDIDGDGTNDYVLQDEGRIVISTQSITVDTNFRYIGGQIAAKPGSSPALTFQIRKRTNNKWVMLVNRRTFCGMYDNREDCLGVLYGYYTHYSGLDDGFAVWLADSLERGSILDPDANSPFELEQRASSYIAILGSPDANEIPHNGTLAVILQYAGPDGVFESFGSIDNNDLVNGFNFFSGGATVGNNREYTFFQGYQNQPDNTYARAAVVDLDTTSPDNDFVVLDLITDSLTKNETPGTSLVDLTVDLSGQTDTDAEVEVEGLAYPRVLGDPVLQPGDSVTYEFDWFREIPELTDLTNDAAPPVPVIGAVSIVETDGPTYEVNDNTAATTYTFTIDTSNATANDLTYAWTVASAAGGGFDVLTPPSGPGLNDTTIEVQFDDASTAYEINCTVSSATASDSPQDAAEVQITTEASAGPTVIGSVEYVYGPTANTVSQPPTISGVLQSFRARTSGSMGTNSLIRFSPGTVAADGYPAYDTNDNTTTANWKTNFDNNPTHFFRIFIDGNQWGSDRYNGDFILSNMGNYYNVTDNAPNGWYDDLNGNVALPDRQNMTLRIELYKE